MKLSLKAISPTLLLLLTVSNAKSQSKTAEEYMTLAEEFKKNAKPDSAIICYEKASREFQNTRNAEGFVNSYNQIGILLTRQDKYDSARTYLNRALSRSRSIADSNSLVIATTNISLGVLYAAEGDYTQSLAYHNKALAIRLLKLGEDDEDVATCYGNIGNVYFRSKDYPKATENHLLALKIREKRFGKTSVETVQSYHNLGNAYKEMKAYNTALEYYQLALQNKIIQLGEKHKDLAKYYKSISDIYFLMGNKEQGDLYKAKANEN
jgi:tetratricopeptide (TPR) repeat protein